MNNTTESKKNQQLFSGIVLEQFKQKKATLKDAKSYHNKDLLSDDVIDLVTKKSQQSSFEILGANGIKRCIDDYALKLKHNVAVQKCAKQLFKQSKEEGTNELENRITKAIKSFNSATKKFLTGPLNKVEYMFWVLYPVFLQATLDCNVEIRVESCLTYTLEETLDDEEPEEASEVDMIFYNKHFGLPICLVEVSDAPSKVDRQHYLGDRNKLAIKLKKILSKIEREMPTPNFAALQKIRLFGIQVYQNVLYLYSLSKPTEDFYVFVLEMKHTVPSNNALLSYQVPSFLGAAWNIGMLLDSTHERIAAFAAASAEEDVDSSSISSIGDEIVSKKSRHE